MQLLRDQSQHLITDLEDQKRKLAEQISVETVRAQQAEAQIVEIETRLQGQVAPLSPLSPGTSDQFVGQAC